MPILSGKLSFHARAVLLLALLLAFGSEVLLWPHAPGKTPAQWLLAVVLYPAVAALLLHIASRYRMRDLFGLMALAGIYGIFSSILINPTSTLADVPRTWFTRVLGAHSLIGLLLLGMFLALLPAISRRRMITTALCVFIVSFGWGTWAKWSPTFAEGITEPTPLPALLAVASIGMALITAAVWLLARSDGEQQPLKLSRRGLAITVIVLVLALIFRLFEGSVDGLSVITLGMFALISLGVLYYQERPKGSAMLDMVNQSPGAGWAVLLVFCAVSLILGGIAGYSLERGVSANDPVFIVTNLFTGYGIAWLPAVAGVLGARALIRQARMGRL